MGSSHLMLEMTSTTARSPRVCRSLLEAGAVHRVRVVVFPVITGATEQDRIVHGYPDVASSWSAAASYSGRLQLLEYVPTVLDAPPGCDANHQRGVTT